MPVVAAAFSAFVLSIDAPSRGSLGTVVRIVLFAAVYLGISLISEIAGRSRAIRRKVAVEK